MLSTLQDITISGDVNASGGGGGAGLSGNFGSGGKGGSINITSIGALSISGPILAAGGGAGGTNTSTAAGGGGGSFGGGGGAGISQGGGGGGGGGYYGGGGAGGEFNGAPSGGGGYSGGGGGGGGGGGLAPGMFGGGGGGGGGLGIGGGGGGGQGVSSTAGGAGGAGGTAGTAGTKAGGTPGIGGAGFGGGGAGAASSSTTPGGSGGKGGTGGTAGPGVGTGGAPTGGSGGMFGMGGTAGGAIGAPTNGGDAGTSGAGGNIVLSGQRVTLTGTIGTASANWAGFATSVYAGDTVNALGAGGSITITSRGGTISPTYFADGNYASGATAVPITITSSNSLTSTGGMQAPSITFSGAAQTSPVAGGSFAGLAEIGIIEGDFVVNVTNFLAVTPAELIALIQAGSSAQTLVLSQSAPSLFPGLGFASGGNFTIAPANIPGTFTSLNLPANVTATVTAPVLSYSGTALINGNLNFPTGGTLTVNGSVTGSGSAGATSGTFSLVSQTGNIGAIGTPFNIGVGAGTNISLQAVSGSITVGNLLTAGAGGNGDSTGFGAQNGGNGGAVTIQAAGPVSTSSIRTFGGGGGGNMSSTSSGAGGTGGAVSLSSLSSISVTGDINSSGGGGGGNISGSSPGGAAGNVTLVAGTLLTVSGPILAAGGGNGANSLAISAGGGGSFGGGGGASASNSLRAPAGGGGFYGGGGAGGLGNGFGGTGGGGGFASGGGGGGGSGGAVATPGAAGGGGGGLGQGGGGAASLGGSSGSGGGDATTNGQPGSATGMNVGLQAPGGIASQGGGTGGAGSIQPGAAGGAGGAGSPTGGGTGAAGGSGPTAGFSGGAFGVGGQGATNGSDVGSGAGGVVSINAAAISLTGTIGAASTNWPGFPSSVYAGDTINTLGTGGTISITTTASDFVSSNVAGNIRAGSTVHLQANNIGSSLLPAGAVTVISPNISAVAASFANINNTFSLSGPGTGTVTIVGNPTTTNSSAGTTFVLTVPDALMLTSSAPLTAQNVALSTGQPNASIIAGSNVTGTATVALTSPTVGTNVGATINGGSVTIANTHLSSLTISNAGTITASTGSLTASSPTSMNLNVTGGGTMNALIGGITLTATTLGATANSITFNGSQTFNGTTTLNATGPNQSVFVTAPAVVTGNNVLLLNTPFLNNQGKITGNPLILFSAAPGGGTIANSAGNIDLNSIGNLTFVGQSLAILASGSIVNSGGARTINLSTANTAPAGVLTMVAGYNFMPPTAGVVGPTATPFTLTTVGSGNVNLPTVSINTSSTAGSAGGVLVVANGFVNLGNITATAPSGLGGPVTIIGTGITTGSITTTGALGGAITLNSATPNMVTPVTVTNGIVTAGSFAPAVFGGNLILGTLNSGSGNITIATGSNGFYILGGTPNTSAVLSVMTGTTDINLFAFNAARVQLNTAANANIFSANAVGLNASTVAGNLSLTALGLLTVAGNVNAANVSLTTSGLNSGITVNSAITATAGSTPTITLSATGSVQLNGGLTANRVNVTTTGGAANNFVLNADITGVGANSQVSLNSFTGPNLTRTFGTIAAGTVGFSFAGAVGTNANRIVTNAGTLNLVNGGSANNVFITQQNSVTLGSSGFVSAGGTLNVIVQNGNLTFQSMFAGQNISLLAQNGGAVQTVGGFVSNATGGIFVTAGGGALSLNGGFFAGGTGAGAFSAATGTSTIGPVTVNNGALTIDAINGGVSQQNFTTLSTNTGNITIITRNGDALLNGFVRSNVNGGISITANMGNITFRGLSSAQANDVNVTTSGQGSILALPNSVSSSGMNGFFRLTAKGSTGDITLSDAMISTTGVGSINLLADRNIVVGRMSSQNGSVTGTAGIVGGGSVTTGGVFSLLTTVTGSIIFTQNGAAGQISLGGDAYTFVDGGISLTAAGAGGITSRTLSAGGNGSVQITANTTAGASYTALPFSYIFTNTGNVGVGVAQNVSLQSVMAGGTVSIQAGNGTLSNAGLVSGKSVNLQSGSSATLNGMVRSNNGAVNIQTGGALLVNQSLTSSNGALNIQVNSGSFTTGQSALLAAIGGSMNISTLAPASGSVLLNGGANVLGTGNFALNITSARDLTAGQLFNVTTGNINLTANVGTLQVNNSVIGRADITILHKSIAAQDRIVLGANASVQALAPSAPQGNVVIAITNGPVTNVAGMVPTGGTVTQITSGGGQIFFGPGQFVNTGFTTLNAKGANVTFFRDAAAVDGVNAIQLNSNFIFADPPVPGAVLLPAAVQAAPVLHTGVGGAVPGALHIDSNRQANMVAPTTNVIVPAALLAPTDSTMPSTRALWSGAGVRYDEGSSAGTAANPAAATAPGSATVRFTAGVGSTTGRSVAGSSGASPACSVVDSGPGCSDSGEQTSNGAMGEGKPSGAVLPVDVFNSVLTGFVAKKAGILAGKPSYMKAASEASVKQISDSAFKLDNGEVVVSASRRSTLYSGDYAIEIAPGAIVHATRYGSVLKIRNLCDTAGNAVRLTIGDGKVSLSPGEELVVGPDLATAEAAVKSDYVGRRNARRYVIDSKRAIVKTELSIIALIQRNSLLSNMYTKGSAADHNIMDRVMKMAAALFQVTGRRGAYSAYEPTKENHPIALRSSQPQG